jgi:transposase
LVFLDESGVQTGMKRLYGRSVKGTRVVDQAPAGRWETHTMVAALRTQGVAAAMVTRRAINSITFLGFIEKFLCPTLRPGDVVVMDNLAVHKIQGVEQALASVGAQLWYLPPYSPDLNPIEQAWSKVKSVIRSLCPSSYRRLVRAIGEGLRRIDPNESKNYFRNSGYRAH